MGAIVAERINEDGPKVAGFALPFLLVLYLGLRGGAWDPVIRGEVGIAVWWIVLLGAAIGVLPAVRFDRTAWVGLGLMAGFCVWTGLGIGWSASAERSVSELGREAMYVGVFLLALSAQREGALRRTVNGLAAGLAVIGILGLLSRLHPAWFPDNQLAQFQPGTINRLAYPVNYWNALAALVAMAVPLLLSRSVHCRTIAWRALAAGAIPALALTSYFTLSRGGILEAGVAILALLALTPRRLAVFPAMLSSGAGSAILIGAAAQRDDLRDGLLTPAASSQGDEMLAMTLVVCAGVALLQVAFALADRHELIRLRISPQQRNIGLAAGVLAVIAVLVAINAPHRLSNEWDNFKNPSGAGLTTDRYTSSSGNGRYQLWQSARDANETKTLTGIGPGTYEYWWAREGSLPIFVVDAHSLYMETLAELGVVGLALIGGLIGYVIGVGGARSFTRGRTRDRAATAAATSAVIAFAVSAALDWVWDLPVVAIAFLLAAAAILAPRRRGRNATRVPVAIRAGLAVASVLAIVAVAIPLAGTVQVRQSQADVRNGDLAGAIDHAKSAADLQPYAGTPDLQRALVLELRGDLNGARAAATAATQAESTNWRTWLVLSRLDAKLGDARGSVDAFKEARQLNPRSFYLQQFEAGT